MNAIHTDADASVVTRGLGTAWGRGGGGRLARRGLMYKTNLSFNCVIEPCVSCKCLSSDVYVCDCVCEVIPMFVCLC